MSAISNSLTPLLRTTLLTLTAFALALPAIAQADGHGDWPERDIDFIIPFGAGGGSDAWARTISTGAQEHFGVGWNLQNRPGAGATLAWEYLLDQPADGYTVMLSSPTPVMTALMEDDPLVDPLDFKAAAYISAFRSLIVAGTDSPMADWEGLKAEAEDGPVVIAGTNALLAGVANIFDQAGLDAVYVPYSSTGEAVSDFLGGHVDLLAATASTALGIVPENGTVVMNTSDIALPEDVEEQLGGNVPIAADFGYDGMRFPRPIGFHPDTPDEIVAEFSRRLETLLTEDESVPAMLDRMGEEVIFLGFPEANEDYARLVERMRNAIELLE
ncbi:tripartite tricarboxylate transporter substrate binding protein [Halomonas sp. M5N1S17]|uniref:tripartite tricarboxylate transporter substrate binding protein n=1 Tax=Halomonas alkalisoli TaxID=2907158 RepID=UPI001F42BE71|nr:tripartite tricarboxylate transporter substrate binding protein [Halomonas alkalisoli]MCE9661883.1 tripartite tricarboxylate transporter substrate binding protein [Halomonas alkalisoli]